MSLSEEWKVFCGRGRYRRNHQVRSVEKCVAADGTIRGYYSDLPLDPTLPPTHSLYPSHDHITHPGRDEEMVVEARVINDMKVHLSDTEFWRVIEHLYAVGIAKGQIPGGAARRLDAGWSPARHYGGDSVA
jgi:hypothetical protein